MVQYKLIKDFPGYRVGDDGTVWSCWQPRKHRITSVWRKLCPGLTQSGHQYVVLMRNRKMHTRRVHRLVLETFVGMCPVGMEACHAPDPTATNNHLKNLRWDYRIENVRDRVAMGRSALGERSGRAVLTESQVTEVFRLRLQHVSMAVIARILKVGKSTVRAIVHNKTWIHVLRKDDESPEALAGIVGIRSDSVDITNQTFGSWRADKIVGKRGGKQLWLCTCTCGKQRELVKGDLRRGRIPRCECGGLT